MSAHRPDRTSWLLLLILAGIWGSSFILMKRGLFHDSEPVLSPFQLATARMGIAWLALFPLLFRHGHWLRTHWRKLLLAGVLGNGIPAVLFALAQTRIDSALSGMLNGLTPLMTMIVGAAFFGKRLRPIHLVGVTLGLVGAAGLVLLRQDDGLPAWSVFAILPVLGTLCYGASGNIVKHFLYSLPAPATAALALTFVGPACIAMALMGGITTTVTENPHGWSALGYVAILAVLSSALALVLWNTLLQRASALWASSVTYLMPIVAIGWGLLDGEAITAGQLVMIAVVLSGVYLVNLAERR